MSLRDFISENGDFQKIELVYSKPYEEFWTEDFSIDSDRLYWEDKSVDLNTIGTKKKDGLLIDIDGESVLLVLTS